eukprot:31314-Pelagococcus_subviridis.AAC.2
MHCKTPASPGAGGSAELDASAPGPGGGRFPRHRSDVSRMIPGTASNPAAVASPTPPSRSNSTTTSALSNGSTRTIAAVARATAAARPPSSP